MTKTNTEKTVKTNRAPDTFTYNEYRRYFYGDAKKGETLEDAEALGRKLAKDAIKTIKNHLKK